MRASLGAHPFGRVPARATPHCSAAEQRPPASLIAALVCSASIAGGISGVNGVFGVLDNTADELADLLGVDEVPQAAASVVRSLRPIYAPLKSVSRSCTDGLFPEFNEVNDFNDCLLLGSRVVWRPSSPPLLIKQTMTMQNLWKSSTGSSVWGGGLVLSRYMEVLGSSFWSGKRVIELGTGTGLGSITAAKLGASAVLATDRDPAVLELAGENARANLGRGSTFRTAELTWGSSAASLAGDWDVVIGADLTYNREAWPALADTINGLRAPLLLSASERRPNELKELQAFLSSEGLDYERVNSPFSAGYASSNVKLFWINPR